MTAICPFCKGPLKGKIAIPPMRERMQRIYMAVLDAGPTGIPTDDLQVRMYADDELPTPGGGVVLRVMIHEINKKIAHLNQRIVNPYRGRYCLMPVKDSPDAQKVQQEANS